MEEHSIDDKLKQHICLLGYVFMFILNCRLNLPECVAMFLVQMSVLMELMFV